MFSTPPKFVRPKSVVTMSGAVRDAAGVSYLVVPEGTLVLRGARTDNRNSRLGFYAFNTKRWDALRTASAYGTSTFVYPLNKGVRLMRVDDLRTLRVLEGAMIRRRSRAALEALYESYYNRKANAVRRVSEYGSDRRVAEFILNHFPEYDGYIANVIYRESGPFHPEMMLGNPRALLGEPVEIPRAGVAGPARRRPVGRGAPVRALKF